MIKTATMPPRMQEKLAEVKHRKTKVDLQTAVLLGIVVFIVCMFGALAIDWAFVLFSRTIRSLLTLTTFAAATIAAVVYARRVVRYRSNWDHVAAEVDQETPALQERWMTVANLTNNERTTVVDGRFLDHVTQQATELEAHVVPKEIVSSKWKWRAIAAIGCLVAAFFVALCCDVQRVGTLTMRFLAPTANISMTVPRNARTPGVAARNEPFSLDAEIKGRHVDEATLTVRERNEQPQSQIVFFSAAKGVFEHRINSVDEPFSYRWRAGDGQTKWRDIEVADRPELAAVSLQVTPPAYTGRTMKDWDSLPKRVAIPMGSQVVVRVLPSTIADIKSVQISNSLPTADASNASEDGWFEWTLMAQDDFELSPVLEEKHGLINRRRPVCRVRVQPDKTPVVTIVKPAEETVASADDEIEIAYRAKDDHGIAKAELLVYREDDADTNEEPAAVIPLPLSDEGKNEIQGTAFLDLDQLELEEGESISYSIRVYDSREQTNPTDIVEQQSDEPEMDDQPDPEDLAVDAQSNGESSPPTYDSDADTESNAEQSSPLAKNSTDPTSNNQSQATGPDQAQDEEEPDTSSPPNENANDESIADSPPPPMSDDDMTNPDQDVEPGEPGQTPPAPQVAQRRLDVGQSAKSTPMRVKVDSSVGDYESQQREKLEIAIAPVLKKIDQLLQTAGTQTNRVVKDLDRITKSTREHDGALSTASRNTKAASNEVDDLLKLTTSTPYAFVGLQVADIRDSNIETAGESLGTALAAKGKDRLPPSREAWQNMRRAQERLSQLSARFERVQRELKLADDVKRIKKMYNVVIEDSLALLTMAQDQINRYERNPAEFELDEEYLARLQEVLEMQRDLRAELAKILANDPRLMRRFSQALRGQTDSLRDQMTLLVERQKDLTAELQRWHSAAKEEQPKIAAAIWGKRLGEANDVSLSASDLLDKFETWLPLDVAVPSVEKARQLTTTVAADARQVADLASQTFDAENSAFKKPSKQAIDTLVGKGREMSDHLNELDIALRTIQLDQSNQGLATHILNRLKDSRRLAEKHGSWLQRVQQLNAGKYSNMLSTEQREVAVDTASLTDKLRNLESQLAGRLQADTLPADLAKLTQELIRSLDEDVSSAQLSTTFALRQRKIPTAKQRATEAASAMVDAEAVMDEVFVRAIKELDKLPVQDPISSLLEDPTLDEILAMLESELDPREDLGIPGRPDNLRITSDWMRGGGSGNGNRGMSNLLRSRNQEQKRLLAKAYRDAMRRAEKEQNAGAILSRGKVAGKEVRWNTLASKLSDRLLQGDGEQPPERYRKPIEQYFDRMSRLREEDVLEFNQ